MWHAALALLADRFDEAERHSETGRRIGLAAQDDNAALLFGTQRFALLAATGRLGPAEDEEILRRVEQSPARGAWLAALTLRRYAVGDHDAAARRLATAIAELDTLPLDANWLYAIHGFGVIAQRLRDERAAAVLYPRLLPFGDRIITIARGSYCIGSARLALGLLAATLGDGATAREHLEAAAARNEAIGAVFYARAARAALQADTADADEVLHTLVLRS